MEGTGCSPVSGTMLLFFGRFEENHKKTPVGIIHILANIQFSDFSNTS
jgi:hypothetical protein